MLRISDARMSGTGDGACMLIVFPESAVGGPLALVRDGDEIEMDVEARRLWLHVQDAELEQRRAAWERPAAHYQRGYGSLYNQQVSHADKGAYIAFLQPGTPIPATQTIYKCIST